MSSLKFFYRALYKRDTLRRGTFVRIQITQCDRRKGRWVEDELKSSENDYKKGFFPKDA